MKNEILNDPHSSKHYGKNIKTGKEKALNREALKGNRGHKSITELLITAVWSQLTWSPWEFWRNPGRKAFSTTTLMGCSNLEVCHLWAFSPRTSRLLSGKGDVILWQQRSKQLGADNVRNLFTNNLATACGSFSAVGFSSAAMLVWGCQNAWCFSQLRFCLV